MLSIYLKTAFREISKNKIFSLIHIIGLSTGIAAFVIILVYAMYELSYDRFYQNAADIYRIRQDRYDKGKLSTTWGAGCAAVGPAVKKEFPEVAEMGILTNVSGVITLGDKAFRIDRMFAANTDFLTMLPIRLVAGVDSTALNEPFTVVLSETSARKIFGDADPLGKTIKLDNQTAFRVTGVFSDVPENTHLKFNILFSWATYVRQSGGRVETAWGWDGFLTYIRLVKGTDMQIFEKKMNSFAKNQAEGLLRQYDQSVEFMLQPFTSIHLNSDLMWETEVNGSAETVYFLMAIAFLILLVAWVNYINLSTVKAAFRSKEIAIRKISGASRKHIVWQFIAESFSINLIATILAVGLVVAAMPAFRSFTGKDITLNTPLVWMIFILVVICGPLFSGVYPALVTSSFRPMAVFRGESEGLRNGAFIRKALIVFQFAVSVILIAGTFTVYRQLKYMTKQDLGVSIDQTIVIKGPSLADSTFVEKMAAFKAELLRNPRIAAVSVSTCVPGGKVYWNAGGIRRSSEDNTKGNQYRIVGVDYDYINSYRLSVLTGRSFSREFGSDEQAVMFNESAVRLMGFESPENAVGESIYFWGSDYKIIGVLKNYHQESLKENFDALIFRCTPGVRDNISVKINPTEQSNHDYSGVIGTIRENWDKFFTGNPFDYYLLNDHYEDQYKSENQFMTIFELFSFLAILIACLGLFGLSWFIIARKTREIGIRKVHGASFSNILLLISGNFIRLVLFGILLAAPVTFYFALRWLEKFAWKTDFNWGFFILAGFIIIFVAILAIGYNVIKVAGTNPAESIRENG